jgi:Phage integrase, N-terminal SAM-like domain
MPPLLLFIILTLQQKSIPMAKKLLDQMRDALRTKHYAYRTEETYLDWVRRYILFHKKRHPGEMGAPEIQAFLTHLATERNVAASIHTAPAVGAGGTRRLAPSSSCIDMS